MSTDTANTSRDEDQGRDEDHDHDHDHHSDLVFIDEKDCCDKFLCTSVGFLLLFLSIFVTYLNENQYIMNSSDIKLLNDKIQDINTDINDFDKYKNRPIYIYGSLNSNEIEDPFDDSLYISYPGMAIRIVCEIYQWIEIKETESKLRSKSSKSAGNVETTNKYRYKKKWVKKWVDSSKFEYQDNHYNPISNEFDKEYIKEYKIKPQRTIWTESNIFIRNIPLSSKLYNYLEHNDTKWKSVTMEVKN